MAYAKIFIAKFIHEIIKIFHELSIKAHVKEKLASKGIEEVIVIKTLTDTDSASFQFITVCDVKCSLKQVEVEDLLLKIIIGRNER